MDLEEVMVATDTTIMVGSGEDTDVDSGVAMEIPMEDMATTRSQNSCSN